ncbi:hypothetical protein VTK73DRAFT_7947 [Phialemonium thermophilum]|uniref:Sugar-phosphatase n=1 Tax=Phialemonium thermophilum TaxID=223376 RepID=A0ABR3XS08_9PEZI
MGSEESGGFKAPPQSVSFDGLLFDMDGTLIDSTDAVVKHWHTVGEDIGVDPKVILQTSHGRRSIDILKILAPDKANWDYVRNMEAILPQKYGPDAVEIPGARALLNKLITRNAPWAIVTSGTEPLVEGWLKALNLPMPPRHLLITAESVTEGKPHPGCYILGRERLGLSAPKDQGDCAKGGATRASEPRVLVLEDSPAGIRAGKAAGCFVLGLVTSHTLEQVLSAEPDWVVQDLRSVSVVEDKSGEKAVTVEIRDAFVTEKK